MEELTHFDASAEERFKNDPHWTYINEDHPAFIQSVLAVENEGPRSSDALHVELARRLKCDVFLTNDAGIACPEGVQRVLVSELC